MVNIYSDKKQILRVLFVLVALIGILQENTYASKLNKDSLVNVFQTEESSDEEKLEALNVLIKEFKGYNLDSSIYYCDEFRNIALAKDDPFLIAKSNYNYASVYSVSGNYQLLTEYGFKALDQYKRLEDSQGQINVLLLLARMYSSKNEFDKAYQSYDDAMQIAKATNDKNSVVLINMGISNAKFEEEDLEESERYLLKCIEDIDHYTKADSAELLAKIFNNLGNVSSTKENAMIGIDYYKRSLNYYQKVNDKFGISLTAFNIGDVYNYNDQYDSAIKYFKITEQMGKELHNYEELFYANLGYTEAFQMMGDFEKAYEYQEIQHAYSDSLMLQKYDKTVVELEEKYSAQKQANELIAKEKEIQIAEQDKADKQKTITMLTIGGGALFVLVLGLLFLFRKSRIANIKIKEQSTSLDKALKQKEILLKEVHHRVKNNLQLIASLLNLQLMNLEDETAQKAIEESKARVQAIALMHKGLYQDENYNSVELKSYVNELVDNLRTLSNSPNRKVMFNLEIDDIHLNIDKSVPIGLIISELIGNSLKHAFKDIPTGVVSLSILNQGNLVELRYKDNGVGLPENFNIEEQDSLGFTVISALVEQINGEFHFVSYSPFNAVLTFSRESD